MSYTELFGFDQNGDAYSMAEIKNAFRGAMMVWEYLENKYLPFVDFTRILSGKREEQQKVWDLSKDDRLSRQEKIVLLSTFDNVVVKQANFKELIRAFLEFPGEKTSLKEQAEIIKQSDCIAVAWNQTSVNCDYLWSVSYKYIDKEDIPLLEKNDYRFINDAEYIIQYDNKPYNLFTDKGHWFLFDHLKR